MKNVACITLFLSLFLITCSLDAATNRQPNQPSLSGPWSGTINNSYAYSTFANDPDANMVKYAWDWGDGTVETNGLGVSGWVNTVTHSWKSAGSYNVQVIAIDEGDKPSNPTNITVNIGGVLDAGKYPFEGSTWGWTGAGQPGLACTGVSTANSPVTFGTNSLQANINFQAVANFSNAYIYVDHTANPGSGLPAGSVNLNNVPWSIMVYCPAGSGGSPVNRNGLRIFFRDNGGRYRYGPWENIEGTILKSETWARLSYTNGVSPIAWEDPGFDDTSIDLMGIRLEHHSLSSTYYTGPIYIDSITWGSGSPPNKPSQPWGPGYVLAAESHIYQATGTDPDAADKIAYEFSWGDGSPNTFTVFDTQGWTCSIQHAFLSAGNL